MQYGNQTESGNGSLYYKCQDKSFAGRIDPI